MTPSVSGMRFGFSTLGCSGRALDAVADLAVTTGWRGVELRAADDEPVHVGLAPAARSAVRDLLARAGVAVVAVASYVRVADGSAGDDEVIADLAAHVELAVDLGAPYVRVFPGATAGDRDADSRAVARLRAAADGIGARPVAVALETHDSHPRGADVARVLDGVGDRRVRAIWDVLHPWRVGEPVTETAAALRDHLAYVQIKDAASRDDLTPVPPGHGAVPLDDVAAALGAADYHGWVSLEWEAKWYPQAAALGDALRASDGVRQRFVSAAPGRQ